MTFLHNCCIVVYCSFLRLPWHAPDYTIWTVDAEAYTVARHADQPKAADT